MKASELRIGNWLLFTDWPAQGFRQMTGNDIGVCEKDPKWLDYFFKPIPLTEEWLLKFGFDKGSYFFSKDGFEFYLNDGENGNWYPLVGGSVKIEYVHQLQNLYFALTGEELTIQP
jgi:hypothetical protein